MYLIDDQEAYGRGLALLFKQYFRRLRAARSWGRPACPARRPPSSTQISLAKSRARRPIFFGGTTGNGCGLVRRDIGSAGFNVPFLGGDGCEDTKFIADANSGAKTTEAEGSYATSAPDVTKLASAQPFFSQYAAAYSSKAAPYNDGTKEPYTAYGYDAMNILLKAIKRRLDANGDSLWPSPGLP